MPASEGVASGTSAGSGSVDRAQTLLPPQSALVPQGVAQVPTAPKHQPDLQALGSNAVQGSPPAPRPAVLTQMNNCDEPVSVPLSTQLSLPQALSAVQRAWQVLREQMPEAHSAARAQVAPAFLGCPDLLSIGTQTRAPEVPFTHKEPAPQSLSAQHAVAQRLADSLNCRPRSPGLSQNPSAHSASERQPPVPASAVPFCTPPSATSTPPSAASTHLPERVSQCHPSAQAACTQLWACMQVAASSILPLQSLSMWSPQISTACGAQARHTLATQCRCVAAPPHGSMPPCVWHLMTSDSGSTSTPQLPSNAPSSSTSTLVAWVGFIEDLAGA